MAFEHNNDTGSIFPNDRKTSENHPGWKGSAKIGGADYWVSGWVKANADGTKRVNLAFTAKEQQAKADFQAPPDDDMSDDIPF